MDKATPRPWSLGKTEIDEKGSESTYVYGTVEGVMLGSTECRLLDTWGNGLSAANAELIVRAVNAHDALVEALETLEQYYEDKISLNGVQRLEIIKNALKLAKGGEE